MMMFACPNYQYFKILFNPEISSCSSIGSRAPRADGLYLLKSVDKHVYKEYDFEIYKELTLEGMGTTQARKRRLDEDQTSLEF